MIKDEQNFDQLEVHDDKKKEEQEEQLVEMQGLVELPEQVLKSSALLTRDQLRFIMSIYYHIQEYRRSLENQIPSVLQGLEGETLDIPPVIDWVVREIYNTEISIEKIAEAYTDSNPVTRWAKSIIGVSPIVAAGLVAEFDISRTRHANQFFTYCGLNNYNSPWLSADEASSLIDALVRYNIICINDILVYLNSMDCDVYDMLQKLNALSEYYSSADFEERIVKVFAVDGTPEKGDEDTYVKFCNVIGKYREAVLDILTKESMSQWIYKCPLFMSGITSTPIKSLARPSDYLYSLPESHILKQQLYKYKRQLKINQSVDILDLEPTSFFTDMCYCTMPKDTMTLQYTSTVTNTMIRMISVSVSRSIESVTKLVRKGNNNIVGLKSDLTRPPYNVVLNRLCWFLGESFKEVSDNPDSLYGRLYLEKKQHEVDLNNSGKFLDQARMQLMGVRNLSTNSNSVVIGSDNMPKLSDQQLTDRAKRHAVKIFISHLFEIMYIDHYKEPSPVHEIMEKRGSDKYIAPEVPFSDFVEVK